MLRMRLFSLTEVKQLCSYLQEWTDSTPTESQSNKESDLASASKSGRTFEIHVIMVTFFALQLYTSTVMRAKSVHLEADQDALEFPAFIHDVSDLFCVP